MISQLFFKKGLYSSCSWIARSLGLFRQPGFLAGFAFMINPRYPCHPRLKNNIPNGAYHLSLNTNHFCSFLYVMNLKRISYTNVFLLLFLYFLSGFFPFFETFVEVVNHVSLFAEYSGSLFTAFTTTAIQSNGFIFL